jgi:hypothetical protein
MTGHYVIEEKQEARGKPGQSHQHSALSRQPEYGLYLLLKADG